MCQKRKTQEKQKQNPSTDSDVQYPNYSGQNATDQK